MLYGFGDGTGSLKIRILIQHLEMWHFPCYFEILKWSSKVLLKYNYTQKESRCCIIEQFLWVFKISILSWNWNCLSPFSVFLHIFSPGLGPMVVVVMKFSMSSPASFLRCCLNTGFLVVVVPLCIITSSSLSPHVVLVSGTCFVIIIIGREYRRNAPTWWPPSRSLPLPCEYE